MIRTSRSSDFQSIHAVIDAAAARYRGVIPDDCWHDPYFTENALRDEIAAGVEFSVFETDAGLLGVMGRQRVQDVTLIRHAYVRPEAQGHGVGSALLGALRASVQTPVLIGTWAAATWAIAFYRAHGFTLVDEVAKETLLLRYWTVPARQRAASVVLADGLENPNSLQDSA